MSASRRKNRRLGGPDVELLENRQLLSAAPAFVDLTGSVNFKAPATVSIGGKKPAKPISVTVDVVNTGNAVAKGPLTISLYAATHEILDPTDTLLTTRKVGRIDIAGGKAKKFVITDTLGKGVPSGTFYILADINSSKTIGESNYGNNIVASTKTVVFKNPLIAPGPFIVGTLSANTSSLTVNTQAQVQFQLTLGRAGPGTQVHVDEFDSSGDNLGQVAVLLDNGNSANGDALAGDGIYSGIATITPTSAGTFYFVATITDPQLSAPRTSSEIAIVATSEIAIVATPPPVQTPPPVPTIAGTLNSDISTVVIGHPEIAHFSVQVSHATPNTTVEVDEFDSQGNDIGELMGLLDNGSSALGDRAAGDGIYSGVSTLSATAPGTRYFAAVVSDPTLSAPIDSSKIAVVEENPPSNTALQADITDNNNLNQVAQNIINSGGTPAASLAAVASALASDSNVQPGTVQTTSTSIEWKSVDGTSEGVSTDFLTSGANATLGSPPAGGGGETPTPSATPAAVPDTTPSADPTLNVLILSPFASSLSQWDPSSAIESMFSNAGYTTTSLSNSQVTFSAFQNLGQYDAINLFGHGAQLPTLGEGIYTSTVSSVATSAANVWDLLNGGLVIMNNYYVVTPNYITEYAGAMNGTMVEFEACNSLHDTQLGTPS